MTNVLFILVWGAVGITFFLKVIPHPIAATVSGGVLGLFGGLMQLLSFKEGKDSFLDAESMFDVRATLKTTK